MRKLFLCVLILSTVLVTTSGFANKIKKSCIKIEPREGVELKFALLRPENATSSVILFNGGKGVIGVSGTRSWYKIEKGKNFLVRSRDKFAEHGFMVAVIDVPSDRKKKGTFDDWRLTDKHLKDIKGVIDYLKKEKDIPVFLIGTSMGSISVVNAGIHLKDHISGIVLSSSITVTRDNKNWHIQKDYPNAILDLALDKITLPALIVAHKDDTCFVSPPTGAQMIKDAIVNYPQSELKIYSGGKKPKKEGCTFWSQHSYYGIEADVVFDMASFIKANTKSTP
jgi:predicted alpha/beta hydrolase family esterase